MKVLSPFLWRLGSDPASEVLRREGAELTGRVARILFGLDILVFAVMWFPAGPTRGILALSTCTLAVFLGVTLLLVRVQKALAGAWVMCLGLLIADVLSMIGAGLVDVGPGAVLLTVVAVAGVSIGPLATAIFGALGSAAVVGVTFGVTHGSIPFGPTRAEPWLAASGVIMSIVALTVVVVLVFSIRHRSLERELSAAAERDAARVAYLQAQKLEALGRLASGIAHDFNNLLGVVRGASDVLRLRGRDPNIASRMLADLDSAVDRATAMTARLLSYSRNRSNVGHSVDLAMLASELVPLLGRLVGSRIEVALIGADRPLWAQISPAEFEQILMNLAVNGRDAMPSGGMLRVLLAEEDEDTVSVAVEDTGVGIAPEIRREVFAPFFSTKSSGTGLGLATVRDIVEGAGGRVELASQVDEGTTFRIFLQRATPVEKLAKIGPEFGLPSAPGRALVVEDHDLVRRTTTQLMEGLGFEVVPVSQGIEALGLMDAGLRLDIVVTDNVMPMMDGLELCARIRQRGITCPIVMVSGDAPPTPEGADARFYPDAFLPKPFTMAELVQALASVIGPSALGSTVPPPEPSQEGPFAPTPVHGLGVGPS
jgi:signal transduction histidine kinase/ActR/RegA family two-component response regulator